MGGILLSLTGSGWTDRHRGRGSWQGPGAIGLQLTLFDPLISCCLNQASARLQLQTLIDLGILDEMALSLMHQGALPLLDPVAGKWERERSLWDLSVTSCLPENTLHHINFWDLLCSFKSSLGSSWCSHWSFKNTHRGDGLFLFFL